MTLTRPPLRSHSSPIGVVVDEPAAVGLDAERLDARRPQRRRLDLVAVGGERLEPVPQRRRRHRRRLAGDDRRRRHREHVVGAHRRRPLVPGDRVEPPLERRSRPGPFSNSHVCDPFT